MEWTSAYIQVWFFPRGAIPSSITAGTPNTTTFGEPQALFQGNCMIDQHFAQHNIIFDIDFCGDYAGNAYGSTSCPQTANASSWDSCVNFVGNNPANFSNAYFQVNSLVVYSNIAAASVSSTANLTSTTPTVSPTGQGMGTNATTTPSSPLSLAATTSTSSSSSLLGSTTTSSASTTSQTPITCGTSAPNSNNTVYTNPNSTWMVQCSVSYYDNNIAISPVTTYTMEACINWCSGYPGCVAVAWVFGQNQCYLKYAIGATRTNTQDISAYLLTGGDPSGGLSNSISSTSSSSSSSSPISSSSSSSSSTSSSTTSAASSAVSGCPTSLTYTDPSSGEVYNVESGFGYSGYNLTAPVNSTTFATCVSLCANNTIAGCVAAVWLSGSPGLCYQKTALGPTLVRANACGAILPNATYATTSTASSSSITATPASSSASSSSSSTSSAPPTQTSYGCPASNATTYHSPYGGGGSGESFFVMCYNDTSSSSYNSTNHVYSFSACMDLCAQAPNCDWVSYQPGPAYCYFKSSIGTFSYNSIVWGAALMSLPGSSSTRSTTSSSSAASPMVSSTTSSASPTSIQSAPTSPASSLPMTSSAASSVMSATSSTSIAISGSLTLLPSSSTATSLAASYTISGSPSPSTAGSSSSSRVPSTSTSSSVTLPSGICSASAAALPTTAYGQYGWYNGIYWQFFCTNGSNSIPDGMGLGSAPASSWNQCIQQCASVPNCVNAFYYYNGSVCFYTGATNGGWSATGYCAAVEVASAPCGVSVTPIASSIPCSLTAVVSCSSTTTTMSVSSSTISVTSGIYSPSSTVSTSSSPTPSVASNSPSPSTFSSHPSSSATSASGTVATSPSLGTPSTISGSNQSTQTPSGSSITISMPPSSTNGFSVGTSSVIPATPSSPSMSSTPSTAGPGSVSLAPSISTQSPASPTIAVGSPSVTVVSLPPGSASGSFGAASVAAVSSSTVASSSSSTSQPGSAASSAPAPQGSTSVLVSLDNANGTQGLVTIYNDTSSNTTYA